MTARIFMRKMSNNVAAKLINNVEKAEKLVAELKTKLDEVTKFKVEVKIKEVTQENASLLKQVERAKAELIRLETLHGKKQYPLPGKVVTNITSEEPCPKEDMPPAVKREKKDKETKKIKEKQAPTPANDSVVDIRKLDLRIGKIVDINKHPDRHQHFVLR